MRIDIQAASAKITSRTDHAGNPVFDIECDLQEKDFVEIIKEANRLYGTSRLLVLINDILGD